MVSGVVGDNGGKDWDQDLTRTDHRGTSPWSRSRNWQNGVGAASVDERPPGPRPGYWGTMVEICSVFSRTPATAGGCPGGDTGCRCFHRGTEERIVGLGESRAGVAAVREQRPSAGFLSAATRDSPRLSRPTRGV